MAETTASKMNLSIVSKLLIKTRKATPNPSDTLREVVSAVTRCNKASEFLKKCTNSGWVTEEREFPEPSRLGIAAKYGVTAFEEAETAKGKDIEESKDNVQLSKERVQEAINELDGRSREVAEFVCSQSACSCLQELDGKENSALDSALTNVPEVKLWWMASFGPEKEIPWETFWGSFTVYMADVYGYPVKDHDLAEEIESGIQSCLGKVSRDEGTKKWTVHEDIKVTMHDFKMLYQRFGPWSALYLKTLTLIDDAHGLPSPIFYPSNDRDSMLTYLKQNKATTKFIVRFSSEPGCLVYQKLGTNILLTNGMTGYILPLDADKTHEILKDIPHALEKGWNVHKPTKMHEIWGEINDTRRMVATMESSTSSRYMTIAKAEDVDLFNGIKEALAELKCAQEDMHKDVKDVKVGVKDVQEKMDVVFNTVMTIGLECLKGHDVAVPSVFYIIPTDFDTDDNANEEKAMLENWDVHILCEGELKTNAKGEEYFECHETDDEVRIKIPNDKLAANIPFMRVGVQLAKMAIGAAACESVPGGPVVAAISEALGVKDKLDAVDAELSNFCERNKLVKEIGAQELQDSRKQLLTLLKDDEKWGSELDEGKCGKLTQMWNIKSNRPVWVCKKHATKEYGNGGREPTAKTEYKLKSDESIRTYPRYLLTVTCEKGEGLPNVETGVKAGKSDLSDPYVKVTPIDSSGKRLKILKTKRINNDLNPVWAETKTWKNMKSCVEKLQFEVYDHNTFKKDVFMGRCEIDMSLKYYEDGTFMFDGPKGLVDENGGDQGKIHLTVKCRPV